MDEEIKQHNKAANLDWYSQTSEIEVAQEIIGRCQL